MEWAEGSQNSALRLPEWPLGTSPENAESHLLEP